jgi:hypothetical protein
MAETITNKENSSTPLDSLIQRNISEITGKVKQEMGTLGREYSKFRNYHRVSVLLIAIAFLLPNLIVFLMSLFFNNLPMVWRYVVGVATSVLTLSFCGYYAGKLYLTGRDVIDRFHKGIDEIVYEKIFNLFGIQGKLVAHSVLVDRQPVDQRSSKIRQMIQIVRGHVHSLRESKETDRVLHDLATSLLLTESFNKTRIDCVFEIDVAGSPMRVAELEVKNVDGAGRRKESSQIFKGYFVTYQLPHTCQGKTFISTEGDLYGFAHRTYWNALKGSEYKEVLFKWTEFENLIHVASDNEKETRRRVTAPLMHDLYEWWSEQSANIRISFVGNLIYILFPDEQIRFEETVEEINEKELSAYLKTIAKPLLSVLHLIEHVRE